MYRCYACGFTFAEPYIKRWYEATGERWAMKVCPDCGGDEIEEVDEDGDE